MSAVDDDAGSYSSYYEEEVVGAEAEGSYYEEDNGSRYLQRGEVLRREDMSEDSYSESWSEVSRVHAGPSASAHAYALGCSGT